MQRRSSRFFGASTLSTNLADLNDREWAVYNLLVCAREEPPCCYSHNQVKRSGKTIKRGGVKGTGSLLCALKSQKDAISAGTRLDFLNGQDPARV